MILLQEVFTQYRLLLAILTRWDKTTRCSGCESVCTSGKMASVRRLRSLQLDMDDIKDIPLGTRMFPIVPWRCGRKPTDSRRNRRPWGKGKFILLTMGWEQGVKTTRNTVQTSSAFMCNKKLIQRSLSDGKCILPVRLWICPLLLCVEGFGEELKTNTVFN